MNSKDVIILVTSSIFGIVLGIVTDFAFKVNEIKLIWLSIGSLLAMILIAVWIFYMRIREAEEDIIKYKSNQDKIEEKLKIHENLVDIMVDIKELQRKVFRK